MMPMYATIICDQIYDILLHHTGFPEGAASCLSKTIMQMVHKIFITNGISTNIIDNTLALKLGGTGQGSAGSGISWHCHMEPILHALPPFSPGFQFTDVTYEIHFVQYIIGKTNDNSIVFNLPNDNTTKRHNDEGAPSYFDYCNSILAKKYCNTQLRIYHSSNVSLHSLHGYQHPCELHMATMEEHLGSLIIQDSPTSTECIRHVESYTDQLVRF